MINKTEFCGEIKRRGKIEYGRSRRFPWRRRMPKGFRYDGWAIQRVRPTTTLIYRGRFPVQIIYIDDIQKINPPEPQQIRFRNQAGDFVEEADERCLEWLDALPYVNRMDTKEIIITYAEVLDNQKLVAQFKNTGTMPVRPIIPIYIDGEYILSKQPIGSKKLGLMDEVSVSYLFRSLSKGEHTVKIKGYPGTDEKILKFKV